MTSSFNYYLKVAKKYYITDEQTLEYLKLYYQGKTEYRQTIILGNINLVLFTIKLLGLPKSIDDYFDIGMVGLILAVDKFDIERYFHFSNYAITIIKNELLMYLRKKDNKMAPISVFSSIGEDNEKVTILSTLCTEENIAEEYFLSEQKHMVKLSLAILSDREIDIMTKFFGIDCTPIMQIDIAKEYGVSHSRICKIIKRALIKMREYIIDCDLENACPLYDKYI